MFYLHKYISLKYAFWLLLHILEEQHYREYASEKFKFGSNQFAPQKQISMIILIITRKTGITSQFFFFFFFSKKDTSNLKYCTRNSFQQKNRMRIIYPDWILGL